LYPSSFDYHAPTTVSEVVALLGSDEDAKVLAGGQSLIPMMKLRFARPSLLVDLQRIPSLQRVAEFNGHVHIGAMVREHALCDGAGPLRTLPIIRDTAMVIADPLVRNCATVGGNLAHGDAENDQPATMIALDAVFVVHGAEGQRLIAAEAFFHGLFETELGQTDVLTEIRIPQAPAGTGSAYVKLRRQVGDYAIVAAAVNLTVAGGIIVSSRLVLTGLASTPVRASDAEGVLNGRPCIDETLALTSSVCAESIDLRGETGSPAYLERAVQATVHRALRKAAQRAQVAA
jgi:carbon-monoxide dehydrogenase medium subunit